MSPYRVGILGGAFVEAALVTGYKLSILIVGNTATMTASHHAPGDTWCMASRSFACEIYDLAIDPYSFARIEVAALIDALRAKVPT